MNKLTKQDVIDAKIVVHGAGEYSPTTYAVSVIEQLEEYVSSLEQQLKTANSSLVEKAIFDTAQKFAPENTTYSSVVIFAKEYANNLEGK